MKDIFARAADPAQAVHFKAKALEDHILLQSAGAEAGDVVLGGYVARGKNGMGEGPHGKAGRKDGDMLTQIAIDQLAKIEAQLAELYEQRDDLLERLNDFDIALAHRQRVLRDIARGDLPETGEDGAFEDEELEALVAAHERKTGHSVDRSDPNAIAAIVAADQERLTQDRAEAQTELQAVNEKIDGLEAQADALNAGRDLDKPDTAVLEERYEDALDSTDRAVIERDNQSQTARFDDFTF